MAWTEQSKSSMAIGFLLQELGDYILQEDGGKIILQEVEEWTPQTKHTSEWTPITKH
jgi:hypothetical protein